MGLQKIEKLLHGKGNNYQSEEIAQRMGEYFCQLFIRQRVNIQNI
jgi:hypothetical protein